MRVQKSEMPITVGIDEARDAALGFLAKIGIVEPTRSKVVDVLIDAECRGHSSHGLALLETYAKRVRHGGIRPDALPSVYEGISTVTRICANGGFGQVAAFAAAEIAAKRAKRDGMHAVAVYENNHIGMLAAYRNAFCAAEVVGLIFNISGPSVAPPKATKATLGNNALCIIVPQGQNPPFIADMATGLVASGKIRSLAAHGKTLPSGWLLDSKGRPTDDASCLDLGGSVPVFGDHKGLVVHIFVEVLAGMLAGGRISAQVNRQRQSPDAVLFGSQLFVGLDPAAFGNRDLNTLVANLRHAVASGYDEDRIEFPYFPEQAETQAVEEATNKGLNLDPTTAGFLGLTSDYQVQSKSAPAEVN
jgi:LDH2 family malate/lactate/ureidoglycolate dehydrogenase